MKRCLSPLVGGLELAGYVLTASPADQECSWTKHPPFEDYKPDEVAGANCTD